MFKTLFFMVLNISLFAGTLELREESSYNTEAYLEYASVKDRNETALNLRNHHWVSNQQTLNLNRENQSYWIHLALGNLSSSEKKFTLLAEKNFIYSLEYFLIKNHSIIDKRHEGFHRQAKNPTHIVFPFKLDRGEKRDIYIKVQNFNQADIPFKIVSNKYLEKFYQNYYMFQGIFLGVMFMMALYSLILYLITKNESYLYYVGYVLSVTLYMGIFFGYFNAYHNLDSLLVYATMILGSIGFLVSIIFLMRELFSLNKVVSKIKYFFPLSLTYFSINFILFQIFFYYENFYFLQIIFNMINIMVSIYIVLLLFSLYYVVSRKITYSALFYVVGWSVLGGFGLFLIALHSGLFLIETNIDYLFEVGILIEVLIFSIILVYRIREKDEKQESQRKLLIQQQKLESMSQMIRSIAHQWRQPLSEINGIVLSIDIDYRRERLPLEKLNHHLSEIEETTAYLSQTIHDFMNLFSHDKTLKTFYMADIIRKSRRLGLSSSVNKIQIDCSVRLNTRMYGYESELLQVLLILLNNSIDALRLREIKEPIIKINTFSHGSSQTIVIQDNAGGIDEKDFEHIFNPYFSTKHASQGTGLGLYIVKIIIEQSMLGQVTLVNGEEGLICTLVVPITLFETL